MFIIYYLPCFVYLWFFLPTAKRFFMNDPVAINNVQSCFSCRVFGSVTFLGVAAFFFINCKHVKPIYYIGIPSMISLSVARAFDLPPFKN